MNMNSKVLLISTVASLLSLQPQTSYGFSLQVSEAPVNNLDLTVSAIKGAQSDLLLNIYELTSPDIVDALLERIQAGVHVEILEEGQPVGGLSSAAKGVQSQLAQAMAGASGGDHLYEMTSKAGGKRRFAFDHAKYAVIDGQRLLIGSENYSPTGNPQPGTVGNRGWEVLIFDASVATQFADMFNSDKDTSNGDVHDVAGSGLFRQKKKTPPSPPSPGQNSPVQSNLPTLSAASVEVITSPNSLDGLKNAIDAARSSVDVELMTFDSAWSSGTNPLVDALTSAARRGVQVRVLLNDESVFNHASSKKPSRPKNQPTADLLNQAGASAQIANVQAMGVDYIHNKGMIIDGKLTLISSINWDENSIMRNRETAVLISSPSVAAHYGALFDRDWQVSGGTQQLLSLRAPASVAAFECPERVSVTASVSPLQLSDKEDESFKELSGQTFHGEFQQAKGQSGCVLTSASVGESSSLAKFFEIRRRSDGSFSVALEGYTSAHKLYSIRARSAALPAGQLSAVLYDGSGPAREALGSASLTVQ